MAKFCGVLAFNVTVDKGNGVWEEQVVTKKCYGDTLQYRQYTSPAGIIDNINLSTKLSVVADSFAMKNFPSILYIEFDGTKWKVSSVEPQYPRLILTTGGVYNA